MPKRQLDALEHLQLRAPHVIPQQKFSHPRFSYLLFLFFFLARMKEFIAKRRKQNRDSPPPSFWNPTEQTKSGSANGWETDYPLANRLSESL
jgi:hypothetical protein